MRLSDLFESVSKPQGSYVACKFSRESEKRLSNFAKSLNIDNIVPTNKFHITIIFSKKAIPKTFEAWGDFKDNPIIAQPKQLTFFNTTKKDEDKPGKALVLQLECPELVKRHEELMEKYDLEYDYDEYLVHTTLSYYVPEDYKISDVSFAKLKNLSIIKEYHEPLDLDWVSNNI